MSKKFRLDGKRALVTGANSDIGRAIAIGLAKAGAKLVLAARSSCQETISMIKADGGLAVSHRLDLSDPAVAAGRLADAGELDILVNNASIIRRNDSVDYTEADWDDVMNVNLKAVFLLSQTFAKSVIARSATGRIVNIASLLSFQGGVRVPADTASKHGVLGLTKSLSNEWSVKGINVNAVVPGYIDTNKTVALRKDPVRSSEILGRIPAGRWGHPSDIADATTFLCTPAASYVTGTTLNVDGGWLAR